MYDAIRSVAAPAGRGPWHDALSGAFRDQVDVAARLTPILPSDPSDGLDRPARGGRPVDQRRSRLPRARSRLGRLRQPRQPADDARRPDGRVQLRGRTVLPHARPEMGEPGHRDDVLRVRPHQLQERRQRHRPRHGELRVRARRQRQGWDVRPAPEPRRTEPVGPRRLHRRLPFVLHEHPRRLARWWCVLHPRRRVREPRIVRAGARPRFGDARRSGRAVASRRRPDTSWRSAPARVVDTRDGTGWRRGAPDRRVGMARPSRSPARRCPVVGCDGSDRQRDGRRRDGADVPHRLPRRDGAARDVEPQPDARSGDAEPRGDGHRRRRQDRRPQQRR